MSLSFKQYLHESKNRLVMALEDAPRVVVEYDIKNYCTIPTAADGQGEAISLKPKMKLVVEWTHTSEPEPRRVYLDAGSSTISLPMQSWSSDKLNKWLKRHTRGERNREYHVNQF